MAAVAEEAGVSRKTVYRFFAGRDELARQAIFSSTQGLADSIERNLAKLADPADIVVEALVLGLDELRSNPVPPQRACRLTCSDLRQGRQVAPRSLHDQHLTTEKKP